jgi:hypothetical protein
MHELLPVNFFQLARFFDQTIPNFPVVMSVIEGRNPGKAWVNQLENPSICLVITNGSYSFIGTKINIDTATLLKIITILEQNKPIKLIWNPNELPFSPFENAGFTPLDRIQFYNPAILNGDTTLIDTICKSLSLDLEVKLIDAALFKKSNWHTLIKLFYGSQNNFLERGFGLALIKNNQLVSEAFACHVGGNLVETGSITSEKYRKKGYATIIRAFLIKECLLRKLQPVTCCNLNNPASAKTSAKLGFIEKMRYQFLLLE